MEKHILRQALSSVKTRAGETFSLTLKGNSQPVEATLVRVFTGKGKGGSLKAEFRNSDGTSFLVGTPDNTAVINMTIDGVLHGSATEADETPSYPRSEADHDRLKAQMQTLCNPESIGRHVRLTSTIDPALNGTYECLAQDADPRNPARGQTALRLERGRFGQIRAMLKSLTDGRVVEVRSYRHSTAISNFEIL